MAVIRKTVTFSVQQDQWIKSQINSGDFTNDSEYLRHLVRQDQEKKDAFVNLKKAIQEGVDSGISEVTIPDIMKKIKERNS